MGSLAVCRKVSVWWSSGLLLLASLKSGDIIKIRYIRDLKSSTCGSDGACLDKMLIKVKTLTGKEIEIDIEPTDKVERIKERVEEKEGIPPPQQRLIFSGKQMNDEKTAADYKVQGGSVLHLVLALRGGN